MKHLLIVVALLSAGGHAYAQGAVSPDRIAQIAKTVHDAEGWNLGASSTRDTRNEFWARVIGIVHHGHPVYNPTPDPSWCLKDGGGGRPQTDDVATQCVSRLYWDCIGGVGSNGYENNFRCMGNGAERLPAVQNVYPPPKPAGGGASTGGGTTPTPTPTPTPVPAVDLSPVLAALRELSTKLDALAVVASEARASAKSAEHDAREINADRLDGFAFPPLLTGCLVGRVPKAFGGSSEVTFCPKVP